MITLNATTFQVGILTACTSLAFLLVALPAGAWVDRWQRKPVLIWGDVGRVLLLGSIPVAWAFDALSLPQLYAVAVLTGIFTVFFDVAYQSYVPVLVSGDDLIDANGKIGASQSFGQVAGPSLAGVLVGAFGAAYAIATDAASFPVWVEGRLWYDGAPSTVHARNLTASSACTLHLEDGWQAVIIDGTSQPASSPGLDLGARLSAAFASKYAARGYRPEPDAWEGPGAGGLTVFIPHKALAWFDFPNDVTRFRFSA